MTRLALVSCVKQKALTSAPARDLYTSALFRYLRRYAEQHADRWLILSAEHCVVEPSTMLAPYERTLLRMPSAERRAWAARVREQLAPQLHGVASVLVLAGARYREHLTDFLEADGRLVDIPLAGMAIGQQLQWLKANNAK